MTAVVEPFREFMLGAGAGKGHRAVREPVARGASTSPTASKVDLRLLIPAFMISELRRGFEIGFLIVLPFLVIDMIVATLTMSMGMMMLPPSVISLPVKILFFVLIDGWNLLIGSLVRSATLSGRASLAQGRAPQMACSRRGAFMTILNTSVSGMQADSNWLSSISQNVANANTTGYKNVETDFSTSSTRSPTATPTSAASPRPASVAQRASGQYRLHRDGDQPRRPGRGLLRRLRRQRRALPDAQRLLHAGRVGQSRQQRRLLSDGRERSERRSPLAGEFADQPREGQCRQRRPDGDADDRRLAHRQSAVDRDAGRRRQSAVGQFGELDLYRCDLARRLRQSRRGAHDQSLFRQHRHEHLGGRRLRRVGRVGATAAFPIRPVRSRPRP